MLKLSLNSKINSFLRNTGRSPLVEITFLGYGGAFDSLEKNSSCIIKTLSGTLLIDCGSTVYSELKSRDLIDDIDYVFITHCHEDHIGSLSTLIYHRFFITKKPLKIECTSDVQPILELYLRGVCGHCDNYEDSFTINTNDAILYSELNMIIHKITTTDFHYKNFPTSGFVFNLKKNGEDFFIVYSGDINVPITDIIEEQNPDLYEKMLSFPENVFIFHEITTKDQPPNYPHCEIRKLDAVTDIFPNIYVYHHGKEEMDAFLKEIAKQKVLLDKVINEINKELDEKIKLTDDYNIKENLRTQAQLVKNNFTESYNLQNIKLQFVGKVGGEFVIQEEMGI